MIASFLIARNISSNCTHPLQYHSRFICTLFTPLTLHLRSRHVLYYYLYDSGTTINRAIYARGTVGIRILEIIAAQFKRINSLCRTASTVPDWETVRSSFTSWCLRVFTLELAGRDGQAVQVCWILPNTLDELESFELIEADHVQPQPKAIRVHRSAT